MHETKDEIRQLSAWLADWHSPADVLAITEEVDSDTYFNQPQVKLLQEAWIAASFSRAIGGGNVRVIADVWPDVEVVVGDRIPRLEVTEAIKPRMVPALLGEAIRKRVAKRYPQGPDLLIYLGASSYDLLHQENQLQFAGATVEAAEQFPSVWVLWTDKAYLVWRDGTAWGGGSPGRPFSANR